MNNKVEKFIKNFTYSLTANLTSLVISTLVTLVVPKLVGVNEYGYWQLYMFYASYVGFFQFGWNDGIYLRYGGEKYEDLDKSLFFSQFWMLTVFQIILAVIIIATTFTYNITLEKEYILTAVAFCMVIVGVRAMPLFILQATNRIKEFAFITMMDRVLYCSLIGVFLIIGLRNYKIMVLADLIGKLISLVYTTYVCKDFVFRKINTFSIRINEALENISVGIKLMFSNIASMLIIGIVRFGIEQSWDVATFGRISLTLSISNLMMLFINALGIIMFPILRRTDRKMLSKIYITMRDVLMVILLALLVAYYPIRVILSAWLPEYANSLVYMALVFPMCIYEGKMALLINTYLKTLREERAMLTINLVSVTLSVTLTFVTTVILTNLNLAIISIVILLAVRSALAEIYLSKILKISLFKDIILESVMTIIFILLGFGIHSWTSVVFYIGFYLLYLFIKRKDINHTLKNLEDIMKK